MPSEIRWPSVAVVAIVMTGIVAMVALQVSTETIGAISVACVAVVGAMRRMYRPADGSFPSVPPLSVLAFIVASFPPLLLLGCSGCGGASTKEAANASYLAQQLECVDKAETSTEADACRARVREAWGVDAVDGGAQ